MQLEMYISYMHTRLLARKMKQSSLRQQCFLESCECFLQLRVYCLCADVQLLRHLCIALFLFAQADEYFTATLRQAVERLDISGKQFFADKSVFGGIGLAGNFGKLFGRECRVPVLFFQVIEGGIFGKDKAVILYVVHFRQQGALFPKLHEDVEHNFLRPFFVLHEIAGNTEQAVVAQIVETVKSPFLPSFGASSV